MRQMHKISCFICDLCGKGYSTKKKIKQHIENVHLEAQNVRFVCDFDGKELKNKKKSRMPYEAA